MYKIWNKKDPIITPIGEVLTPEQWMDRYPVAKLDSVTVICSAGEVNGGFFGTLGQMVERYTQEGLDFTGLNTAEEKIEAINAFEAARREAEAAAMAEAMATPSAEERIAAALEYQNLVSM